MKSLPHINSFTRLGISKIHGIGVFAIKPIRKNTDIFKDDITEMIYIDEDELKLNDLPSEIKKLYEDYCVIKIINSKKKYGCPTSFNNMTVSWYLNHSDIPNVYADKEYKFFALRDIEIDEELTVDYKTLNI